MLNQFILCLTAQLVLFNGAPSDAPGHMRIDDYSPPEAYEAAAAKLEEIKLKSPPAFGLPDLSALADAWLGEPFRSHWAGEDVDGFVNAPGQDMLKYFDRYGIYFPVLGVDRAFGTIDVMRDRNGQYRVVSQTRGVDLIEMVGWARRYLNPGEQLYVVTTGIGGSFMVIGEGPIVTRAAAIDEFAAQLVGTRTIGKEVQFLPIAKIAEPLKVRLETRMQSRAKTDG